MGHDRKHLNLKPQIIKLPMKTLATFTALLLMISIASYGQNNGNKYTKDQVLSMTVEQLSEMQLEDLMAAVEVLGVSSVDELFALIMNKNVSSASKNEESSFTSPLATTVITKEEMRTYGVTTIEDAFRLIPGMIVSQKTNGIYDIHIRGLNNITDNNMLQYTENMSTLVMIDGRIVNNYIYSVAGFYDLPISVEDIERIEVVRGACAALYGMNAVSGVINIITEKANTNSSAVSGSVQFGNLGTVVTDLGLRHAFSEKFSVGLTANAQHRNRPTNKITLAPSVGLFKINDWSKLQAADNSTGYMSSIPVQKLVENGYITPAFKGGDVRIDDINNYLQFFDNNGRYYSLTEVETPFESMYRATELARQNIGFNGYMHFTPASDIAVNLSAGYQQAYEYSSTLQQDYVSANGQESKSGYVNIDAQIKGLHLLANYMGGPIDYSMGTAGYQADAKHIFGQAEYSFNLGNLSIVPAIGSMHVKYSDRKKSYNYGDTIMQLSGFFNDEACLSIVSPSLRLDYKFDNGVRLVAAVRGDKTDKPDKWNVSYQGEASWLINERNFIRLVYGRAFSSPNLTNTCTDFTWARTGLVDPQYIKVKGDDAADLRHIDNFEIGYRWRPKDNILLDAEAYYSVSKDYGALMSANTTYSINTSTVQGMIRGISAGMARLGDNIDDATIQKYIDSGIARFSSYLSSTSTLQYKNLPYDVRQMGISMNLDWIISPKLIFKVNANVQKTIIDNYFTYCQTLELTTQARESYLQTIDCFQEFILNMIDKQTGSIYSVNAIQEANIDNFISQSGWNNWSSEDQAAFRNALLDAYTTALNAGQITEATGYIQQSADVSFNGKTYTMQNPLASYYALKYNTRLDKNTLHIGSSTAQSRELENDHKHKATPTIYGMVGLVYKPTSQITVAAYGNYIGKHTINTSYSSIINYFSRFDPSYKELVQNEIKAKFTMNMKVSYSPIEGMAFFVNAQNLFNNDSREYIYMDKIGGLYTLGIDFKF